MNEKLREIDKRIALLGSKAYVRATFPGAVLIWGGGETPPEPDGLDQVWELPATDNELKQVDLAVRYVAIAATAGEMILRSPSQTGVRFHEGSLSYLHYAIEQLNRHGQHELAESLGEALFLDRLLYLHLHTPIEIVEGKSIANITEAKRFDVSDERFVAQGIDAVHRLDSFQIESLRQQFSAEGLQTLSEQYWQFESWDEKALLIFLVCDNQRQILRAIMEDTLLYMPDVDDSTQWARATAVCYLEGSKERFGTYYNNDDALKAAIAQFKQLQ